MPDTDESAKPQTEHLKKLIEFIVKSRRDTVMDYASGTLHAEKAVDHILECQTAIRALNEALEDEERRGMTSSSYNLADAL